jgi:hypothetical protein
MVGGIEVTKALTPDMDLDSFGGTINLVTRSAFELKERSINGKVEYIYNDFGDHSGFAGALTYMDALNKSRTFGVSATLTYRQEKRWSNRYEISYYDAGAIPVGNAGSGTLGAIPAVGRKARGVRHPAQLQRHTKIGGVLNFDWKLSDTTELHWKTFYEKQPGRRRPLPESRPRALALEPASTALLESGQQVRFVNLFEDGSQEQDVLRLGFDGKTRFDFGTLSYGPATARHHRGVAGSVHLRIPHQHRAAQLLVVARAQRQDAAVFHHDQSHERSGRLSSTISRSPADLDSFSIRQGL